MILIEILAAFLLPPLAVFLRQGLGTAFWVSVLVTLLFWVPGVIFALAVVLKPDLLPARWIGHRA